MASNDQRRREAPAATIVTLPSDCASHLYTFLPLGTVIHLARCCRFTLTIAHRSASYPPFECCRTDGDFNLREYQRWRATRAPLRLTLQQLVAASRSRIGRVAVRDVCIGTVHIGADELPASAPTPTALADALSRLTGVRSLRARVIIESQLQEENGVRTTAYLRAIVHVWASQLRALEMMVRREYSTKSPEEDIRIDWHRLTALEYLRLHRYDMLHWATAPLGLCFRPEHGLVHVTGTLDQHVGEGVHLSQWPHPPRHILWHHEASFVREAVDPLVELFSDPAECDGSPVEAVPTSTLSPRLKSLVFHCHPPALGVPLAVYQRKLDDLCCRCTHLEQIVLQMHVGIDGVPLLDLELASLRRLRRLRVIRSVADAGEDEPDRRTPRFLQQLVRTMDGSSCSSSGEEATAAAFPSVEEITIDGSRDGFHRATAIDQELSEQLAVAFPRLDTLHLNRPCMLAVPVTGVFRQLRHLAWRAPSLTPTWRHEEFDAQSNTLRQLLAHAPLLESLHLNHKQCWRNSFEAHIRVRESLHGFLPLVCSLSTLRRVTIENFTLVSPQNFSARQHWQSEMVHRADLRLLRLHLLWQHIDPTHRVPEEGMDDVKPGRWIDAMIDGLYTAHLAHDDGGYRKFVDPTQAVISEVAPPRYLPSWIAAAASVSGSAVKHVALALASPVLGRLRQRALRARRAMIEAAEAEFRAHVTAEVAASGREVAHRAFELVLIEARPDREAER